jgi:hypothetical protein
MNINQIIQTVVAANPHEVYENALREEVITTASKTSLTLALIQYVAGGDSAAEQVKRTYTIADVLSVANIPDSPEGDLLIDMIDRDGIHSLVVNAGVTARLSELDDMEAKVKPVQEDKKDEVIDTPKEYVIAYFPSFLLICGVLVVGFLLGSWHQRHKAEIA